MRYFNDFNKCPPIYGLQSYKILKSKFTKIDGKQKAFYDVVLNFPPDNVLPTGKTWICELEKIGGSWKAMDFYPAKE
jgi:hypothetical protein